MTHQTPLVSILTPSYNQGSFIGDCLRSVAEQTYPRVEHIVADGGSEDDTVQKLESASHVVDWWSRRDGGQASAVNAAFARASGQIVGWVNSDDALFSMTAVEEVVDFLDAHPDVGIVAGDGALIDASGLILRRHRAVADWGRRLSPVASPLFQPATFIRRGVIPEGEPLLREHLHLTLDLELWLRLRSQGTRIARLGRVLAVDRDHAERKVRVLQTTKARDEYAGLAAEYGIDFRHAPSDVLRRWGRRWSGLGDVLAWERRYRPAFAWRAEGLSPRLRRQLLARSDSHVSAS